MHQALDDSDQTRKYGISDSIIKALIMTLLQAIIICHNIGLASWIQRYHTFSFGHYHQAPGASCSILYAILVLSLVLFNAIPIYPF